MMAVPTTPSAMAPPVQTVSGPVHSAELDRVVNAAVRAAVAWTMRQTEPRAWRELSRMTGVVRYALGPSTPLAGPMDLVDALRRPLRELIGSSDWDEPIADIAVLSAGDLLVDEIYELGSEYTRALFETEDPGTTWLPSFAWQTSEQTERTVYDAMLRGSAAEYVTTRRFLIEHPAGDERDLLARLSRAGALRAAEFGPIPFERTHVGRWWWACPVCRWPMRVIGKRVRCDIASHQADHRMASGSGDDAPALISVASGPRRAVPVAQQRNGARCVAEPVWRFIVVPGAVELDLAQRLLSVDDVEVELWPNWDRCDLVVRSASGRVWEVDIKDHAGHRSILRKPPTVTHVVVPDHRKNQVEILSRLLPGHRVHSVRDFVTMVRAQSAGRPA